MAAVCKQPYPAHCGPVRQVEETQSQWRKQETLIQSLMEEKISSSLKYIYTLP